MKNLFHKNRGQAKRGLIEKQKKRLRHETSSDGAHLLFTAGQRSADLSSSFGQARKHLVNTIQVLLCLRPERPGECPHQKIFLDRHPRPQLAPFGDQTKVVKDSLVGRLESNVRSIEDDSALANGNESGQHFEGGGFAGTVGPDEADHLAALQLEVDIPNHLDRTISRLEILSCEQQSRIAAVCHLCSLVRQCKPR